MARGALLTLPVIAWMFFIWWITKPYYSLVGL